MNRSLIRLGLLGIVMAGAACEAAAVYPPFTNVIVHGCYDGDTCTVTIPGIPAVFGDHLPVRLAGIDAPEMHGKCERERELAIKARDLLEETLRAAARVDLIEPRRDKYFRLLAHIVVDGRDLSEILKAGGLAMPYAGGRKASQWCA